MKPMDLTPPLFIAIITLIGTMVGVYVRVMMKIRELEIRLMNTEKQDDKIMSKLEHISEGIQDIRIEMQNKEDRA